MKKSAVAFLIGSFAVLLIGTGVFYTNMMRFQREKELLMVSGSLDEINYSIIDLGNAVGLFQIKSEYGPMLFDEVAEITEVSEKCQTMRKMMLYTGDEEASEEENIVGYYLSALGLYAEEMVSEEMTSERLIELNKDLALASQVIKEFSGSEYESLENLYIDMSEVIMTNAAKYPENVVYRNCMGLYEKFYD